MYFKSIEFLLSTDTKESASMQETQVQSLGLEDLLEKGRAAHSSALGWRAQWTEESVLAGELGGRRSVAGHSACSHKEADTPGRLTRSQN